MEEEEGGGEGGGKWGRRGRMREEEEYTMGKYNNESVWKYEHTQLNHCQVTLAPLCQKKAALISKTHVHLTAANVPSCH